MSTARPEVVSSHNDALTVWRTMAGIRMLICPVCAGELRVDEAAFTCKACPAVYPVSGGVPLLLRPTDVVSLPHRVMDAFNIPYAFEAEVRNAISTLTQYRATAYPEFANFFARFDPSDGAPRLVPLDEQSARRAAAQVSCLTPSFPRTLCTGQAQYRSIRIRNGSDQVILTDKRGGISIGCKVFDERGTVIPTSSDPSPLPCPVKPGGEVTVAVLVRLPAGLEGRLTVRFYLQFADLHEPGPATPLPASPAPAGRWASRLASRVRRLVRPDTIQAVPALAEAGEGPPPATRLTWFDAHPLAEMVVEAVATQPGFPAVRRSDAEQLDVHEDVRKADAFLSAIVQRLGEQDGAVRLLEIGSGVHPIALRACYGNSLVVVSDISLVMQRLAAIMHQGHPVIRSGLGGFTAFDMMHPPFAHGSFDIICICAAFHHIPEPVGFLRKLAPLLSSRGRFVALREPCVVDPTAPAYIAELSNGFDEQMFELPEWSAILADGGFEIDEAVIDYGCSLKLSARLR